MAPGEQTDEQLKAQRRKRSIALAVVLGALVVAFYLLTIFRMGPSLFERSL